MFKALQNIKIPPVILSCNIHGDITERFLFKSSHVQSGSARVKQWVSPLLAEKVAQLFQPSCHTSRILRSHLP